MTQKRITDKSLFPGENCLCFFPLIFNNKPELTILWRCLLVKALKIGFFGYKNEKME